MLLKVRMACQQILSICPHKSMLFTRLNILKSKLRFFTNASGYLVLLLAYHDPQHFSPARQTRAPTGHETCSE